MKEKIAVAISIISFALIHFGLDTIADTLGALTYIDFGETVTVTRGSGRYYYDEDIDGESTDVGMFIHIASIMLAWRTYHWVVSGKLNGNISKETHTTWLFWLVGMAAYILITTPIWQIEMPGILQRLIVLACGAGIGWFTYNKHGEAIAKIRSSNDDNT